MENNHLFKAIIGQSLGRGSFGEVFPIKVPIKLAMKVMKVENDADLNACVKEFELLNNKNYPNVVRNYCYLYNANDKTFSFSMDLMQANLSQILERNPNGIRFADLERIVEDIVRGLNKFEYNYFIYFRRSLSPFL